MARPAPQGPLSLAFDKLPGSLPPDLVPQDVELSHFPKLAKETLENLNGDLIAKDALWRDLFALTGRVRTFHSSQTISSEWKSRAIDRQQRSFVPQLARVARPTPSSSWIDVPFTFMIEHEGLVGNAFGIVSFVPDGKGWKVWMLRTMLENFEGHGNPDDPAPIFKAPPPPGLTPSEHEYDVIIIGAGQSGLSLAGRLGALGIKYLLLEKEGEIGWSWTGKYDSVRQHTIREMNNLPFERTFREDDPMLLPAAAVARGFKEYVEKYKINIWISAETEGCTRKEAGDWVLNVRAGKGEGKMIVLKAKHLVLSMGAGLSVPNPPNIPGMESFRGEIKHIGNYKNSHTWKGKSGIVVGSATAAHDVAQDMLDSGLSSITMVQRGATPIFAIEWLAEGQSMIYNRQIPPEMADRLASLTPLRIGRDINKIECDAMFEAESARFGALEKVGFRVDRQAVLVDWLLLRGGGYYIDVGTTNRIANGEIKVKSGVPIKRFTKTGLEFDDGEVLEADVVVLATGYQRDARRQAAGILGNEIARNLPRFGGLNEEGEVRGSMKPSADGLWIIGGAASQARFFSRFVALQIQAELLGKPFPDCRQFKEREESGARTKL